MMDDAGDRLMEFNTPRLQLVIMAVQDAIRLAQEELERLPENQQPDVEDYLLRLGNLQADFKVEYEIRSMNSEKLTPYDRLVRSNRIP
jgi:hypothetical protein